MDPFARLKHICQRDKDIIIGYIREAQSLLPNDNNPYYNIPEIVGITTMLYFHLAEYFEFHGDGLEISDDKRMITYKTGEPVIGAVYGNVRRSMNGNFWLILLMKM